MLAIILFFIAHWYLSLFCQTLFHHRYAAHASITMSKGWERFFFILSFITQGSSYLSVRAYAVMHRMHHAYADTDKDPHSPSFSKNPFDMMWKTWLIYKSIYEKTADVDPKFLKNVPDWPAFEKFATHNLVRAVWVAAYIAFYVNFAPSPWFYLLIPIHVFSGPVHGMVINWFAHKFGYRNFEQDDTSENLFRVDWLMLGESYHNNHHKHPSNANFGHRWHEIDPVYGAIKLMNKAGIVKIVKQPKPVVATNRLTMQEEPVEELVG